MEVQTNADGNHYIELDRPQGEKTVLTYIPHAEWAGLPAVEIRVRMPDGKMPWGPQIPVDRLGEFVAGIINLVNMQAEKAE